ncbi:MAG: helix-turn-helix transcriptional regulator, partial [Treponema sp.]|nr:helix-turn-helix transcriptional regulator [Treponema sp.]
LQQFTAFTDALTRREKDVLNLLLRRMSNDQISDELGIKRRAVENYISSIYEKIGINDRAELLLRYGNMI